MNMQEKFIAFVDILGFSDMVLAAEAEGGDFTRLMELTKALGGPDDAQKFSGPTICPNSRYLSKDLSFNITQISDCSVVSAEISPAGVIALIAHCFGVCVHLLTRGCLCRGVITRGNIVHTDTQFLGTGYMNAYRGESKVRVFQADEAEHGTPFVQIDDTVVEYVGRSTDECVQMFFSRMTKSDGKYTAIWPFERLSRIPSAAIRADFDPQKFKESIQRSRRFRVDALRMFEEQEARAAHADAKHKIQHYKNGLIEVLRRLDEKERTVDQMITTRRIPYGTVIK